VTGFHYIDSAPVRQAVTELHFSKLRVNKINKLQLQKWGKSAFCNSLSTQDQITLQENPLVRQAIQQRRMVAGTIVFSQDLINYTIVTYQEKIFLLSHMNLNISIGL